MYFPELEQFANENPKWRDWIATLDQVLEKNTGRVVRVEELREFVPASEKQLDELLDVLCDAKRIERLGWLCCSLHESVIFDPADPSRHCDLCGRQLRAERVTTVAVVRVPRGPKNRQRMPTMEIDNKNLQRSPDNQSETKPMNPNQLRTRLEGLPESMFDEIVFLMDARSAIGGPSQKQKAIELVEYASVKSQLGKLESFYNQTTGNKASSPPQTDTEQSLNPIPSNTVQPQIVDTTSDVTDIVILVHGIRDIATPWYSRAERAFQEHKHVKVYGVKYGFFNALNFLAPLDWSSASYEILVKAYDTATEQHPGARVSIIAHSFGTYLVARLLHEHNRANIHRVLFCGSVVREDFDWNSAQPYIQGKPPVWNTCGSYDPWPVMAKSINSRYGAAGRNGFQNNVVAQSSYFLGGHSVFLNRT
jgi:pimeloyl-ACP methyl ester carboxylesterase